jgi:hypothetical protein
MFWGWRKGVDEVLNALSAILQEERKRLEAIASLIDGFQGLYPEQIDTLPPG